MKLKVAVMFGGQSVEHEISIISANQAINALNKSKYDLIPIYISKEGMFYTGDELLDLSNYHDLDNLLKKSIQVNFLKEDKKCVIRQSANSIFKKKSWEVDIVLPVVHGLNVEDGNLQGFLKTLNIPFVGCDVTSAAVGQDKVIQKCVMQANDINTVEWFWMYDHEVENEDFIKKANKIGFPLIIKPAKLGSSIGIKIVNNEKEFIDGVKECGKFDNKLLIEKVITKFKEINIAVMGNCEDIKLSVTEEVLKNDEILSFEDKYLGNAKSSKSKISSKLSSGMASIKRSIPANVDDNVIEKIEYLALKAFNAIGISGNCRIDFMYDTINNEVYLTEVNTIPGSLAFYLWKEKGLEFDVLLDEMIKLAVDKERRNAKTITSFDTNILKGFKKN